MSTGADEGTREATVREHGQVAEVDVVVEHKSSWWAALATPYYRRFRVLVSCRSCGLEDWGLTLGAARRSLAKHHTAAECERWRRERETQAAEAEAAWSAYLADEEAWRAAVLGRLAHSPDGVAGSDQ